MAISIPTLIEQDFQKGIADYKTYQTGFGPQSVLHVPSGTRVVIFGYVFNPAGGAWTHFAPVSAVNQVMPVEIAQFGTQQILFYTGSDFYPFVHHVNIASSAVVGDFDPATGVTSVTNLAYEVQNTPQAYQTYIQSNKNVSIAHGLLFQSQGNTTGLIPIGPDTPQNLTYGGTTGSVSVAWDLGAVATPAARKTQFLQPSYYEWAGPPYAYGLYAANATEQVWVPPYYNGFDWNGMVPSQHVIAALMGGTANQLYANNYFITLHYALYRDNK